MADYNGWNCRQYTRLMDRSSLDSRKHKRQSSWVADDQKQRHAEYLKRLAELRDDLIGQEKSNLARALERLRLSSITNSDSICRLRLRDGRSFPTPRRQMITTLERFRQMRPVKPAPKLYPLQGKQLIEPKSNRSASSDKKDAISRMSQIDETAQSNLQRFTQPISSIPNIGRKAWKREDLVLNTKGMNRRKPKNNPQTYLNPLSQSYCPSKTNDAIDLKPHAFKLDSVTSGGRLDENLRKLYYFYYVPTATSLQRSEEKASPRIFRKQTTFSKTKRSLRQESDRSLTSSEVTTVRNYNHQAERFKLPVVTSSTDNKMTFQNGCAFSVIDDLVNVDRRASLDVMERDEANGQLSRRHIRVEMPTIIFNCPTPDPREREDDKSGIGSLSKMYKQSEIRQRELKNLFEDVKELNMRTNSLTQLELSLHNG
ncbi:uncharacterized protein LOC121387691 [Gigantopelta aegis]|uniref:uncharacterized protein LOC121387691 n=1 Tax=Gigantopelta aegis TaxID=1735272 RepID=UPI001B88A9B0|nr:uncharacterized protein LOC121387691 [Gigantopelta aegis]